MKSRTLVKSIKKLLAVFLTICLVLPSLPSLEVRADDTAYYYDASGAVISASPADAYAMALSLGTGMGLTADWYPGSRLTVGGGKRIFIEMNGHVLSRALTSGSSDGEVVYMEEGASLTVYGGTKDDPSAGLAAAAGFANIGNEGAEDGYYAQPYLSEVRDWVIGSDYAEMDLHFTDAYEDLAAIKAAAANHAFRAEIEGTGIKKLTYSLNLESNTSIYVYVSHTGTLSVTVDGVPVEVDGSRAADLPDGSTALARTQEDGRVRVSIDDIAAHRLSLVHRIEAETETGSCSADVSALSYVHSALAAAENENAVNAAAAFYHYYRAAAAYLNED